MLKTLISTVIIFFFIGGSLWLILNRISVGTLMMTGVLSRLPDVWRRKVSLWLAMKRSKSTFIEIIEMAVNSLPIFVADIENEENEGTLRNRGIIQNRVFIDLKALRLKTLWIMT